MEAATGPIRTQAGTRLRRFVFTLNNYTELELAEAKQAIIDNCSWGIIGRETGDSNTPHLQGAAILLKQMTFTAVRKLFPRAHIETMRGTPEQSLDYCSKQDVNAWMHGLLPNPGKRKDLDEVADAISKGASMRDISVSHPTSVIKYSRGITILRSLRANPRNPNNPPSIYWLFGPTGTGKTRSAWNWGCSTFGEEETVIIADQSLHWFDGYDGQKCAIIDDFRSKGVSFAFLLQVLDRYPLQVPFKGGFVNWCPEVIFITTPYSVEASFITRKTHLPEDIRQLKRRLTAIVEYPLTGTIGLEQAIEAARDHHTNGGYGPLFVPTLGSKPRGDGLEQDVVFPKPGCLKQCSACLLLYKTDKNTRYCPDCQ